MVPTLDAALADGVSWETRTFRNRATVPVWCAAYFLGGAVTLLWIVALSSVLLGARPMESAPEIELVMAPQHDTPVPDMTPPVKPKMPAPKSAAPHVHEPIRPVQPLVVPTTSDSAPLSLPVVDPTPMPPDAIPQSTPTPPVEAAAAPTPIKVEPLFRLTRVPDFGTVTTLKYPAAEKNRGREGKVVAEFVIDEQGSVRDIKILKSAGALFDQAVIDELNKMTFTPPYIGERAVAARFRREFQFKLD